MPRRKNLRRGTFFIRLLCSRLFSLLNESVLGDIQSHIPRNAIQFFRVYVAQRFGRVAVRRNHHGRVEFFADVQQIVGRVVKAVRPRALSVNFRLPAAIFAALNYVLKLFKHFRVGSETVRKNHVRVRQESKNIPFVSHRSADRNTPSRRPCHR